MGKARVNFMQHIQETLTTPIRSSCDVLVAGGGTAGIAAALAAARQGAAVTLVEPQAILGGLGTAGLVTIFLALCDGYGHQVIYGIGEELFRLSIRHGCEANSYPRAWLEGGTTEERIKQRFRVQFNPNLFAIDAEQLLREAGVTILYGARVCATATEPAGAGKRITAAIIESKSGREAIAVRGAVVDATGDADVALMSGAETALYSRGNVLASWYYAVDGGVRKLKMLGYAENPDETPEELKRRSHERHFGGLDLAEISEMLCLSHAQTMTDFLRRQAADPTLELAAIATMPQLRMTRRIVGGATPDVTDDGVERDDCVGLTGNWRKRGPIYAMPYGSIAARGVVNLFAAGRCVSVTDDLWEITRVIPTCTVTGQAAGTAAAMMAAGAAEDSAALSVRDLQAKLREGGVRLRISDVR